MRRIKKGLILALILASAPVAHPVRAQLVDCGASYGDGFKILLDDIANENNPADMDWLLFQLNSEMMALEAEENVQAVRCAGRKPADTSFNTQVVDQLFTRDVLLEVWGIVSNNQARVSYALIPLLRTHEAGDPRGTVVTAPRPRTRSYLRPTELKAYATLGMALKHLTIAKVALPGEGRNQHLDAAVKYFCHAEALFRLDSSLADVVNRSLHDYALARAYESERIATNDAAYHGTLRILPVSSPKQACGGGQ